MRSRPLGVAMCSPPKPRLAENCIAPSACPFEAPKNRPKKGLNSQAPNSCSLSGPTVGVVGVASPSLSVPPETAIGDATHLLAPGCVWHLGALFLGWGLGSVQAMDILHFCPEPYISRTYLFGFDLRPGWVTVGAKPTGSKGARLTMSPNC